LKGWRLREEVNREEVKREEARRKKEDGRFFPHTLSYSHSQTLSLPLALSH